MAPSGSCAGTYAMLAATTPSPQMTASSSSSSRPRVSTLLYNLQPTSCPRGGNHGRRRGSADLIRCRRRLLTARGERPSHDEEEDEEPAAAGFDAAVALFNLGEYHACHDVVEELWYAAEDPVRTLLHGVLQRAVGFHHLFNQNHRGAMMELGEGLRKLNLDDADDDPFSMFRDEVSSVLQFLYRTQKELAACTDDMCLTMDGSPTSYQLLGDFAAGQQLYRLKAADTGAGSIVFSLSDDRASGTAPHTVKLPTLHATEQNLTDLQRAHQYM